MIQLYLRNGQVNASQREKWGNSYIVSRILIGSVLHYKSTSVCRPILVRWCTSLDSNSQNPTLNLSNDSIWVLLAPLCKEYGVTYYKAKRFTTVFPQQWNHLGTCSTRGASSLLGFIIGFISIKADGFGFCNLKFSAFVSWTSVLFWTFWGTNELKWKASRCKWEIRNLQKSKVPM